MFGYREEIDGLRSIAVIPVILYHCGLRRYFSGGYVGVDIFFVISGYLITSVINNECAEERFSLINFYERRCRRILPALFLILFPFLKERVIGSIRIVKVCLYVCMFVCLYVCLSQSETSFFILRVFEVLIELHYRLSMARSSNLMLVFLNFFRIDIFTQRISFFTKKFFFYKG
jgi:hypothetical protein